MHNVSSHDAKRASSGFVSAAIGIGRRTFELIMTALRPRVSHGVLELFDRFLRRVCRNRRDRRHPVGLIAVLSANMMLSARKEARRSSSSSSRINPSAIVE